MTTPVRVQRKRTRGFNLQEESHRINGLEAVVVTRPTKYGNPFKIGKEAYLGYDVGRKIIETREEVVKAFRLYAPKILNTIEELRGKNLACFCSLDQPCHADELLRLANKEAA